MWVLFGGFLLLKEILVTVRLSFKGVTAMSRTLKNPDAVFGSLLLSKTPCISSNLTFSRKYFRHITQSNPSSLHQIFLNTSHVYGHFKFIATNKINYRNDIVGQEKKSECRVIYRIFYAMRLYLKFWSFASNCQQIRLP